MKRGMVQGAEGVATAAEEGGAHHQSRSGRASGPKQGLVGGRPNKEILKNCQRLKPGDDNREKSAQPHKDNTAWSYKVPAIRETLNGLLAWVNTVVPSETLKVLPNTLSSFR